MEMYKYIYIYIVYNIIFKALVVAPTRETTGVIEIINIIFKALVVVPTKETTRAIEV
jgi:hypothetical protein